MCEAPPGRVRSSGAPGRALLTSGPPAGAPETSVLAGALKHEGFTVVSTCPGWVATDMGTNPEMMKVQFARVRHGHLSSSRLAQGRSCRCCTVLMISI